MKWKIKGLRGEGEFKFIYINEIVGVKGYLFFLLY